MKVLHISAGGKGLRIANYIATTQLDLPKHLLSIPTNGKSLLGKIVLIAKSYFSDVTVWCNPENEKKLRDGIGWFKGLNFAIDEQMTGPMGPAIRALLAAKQRTFGCAGDFYCDFSWQKFEKFHNAQGLPISILAAKSVAAPKGARFNLEGGKITSWERVEKTIDNDRINIGCYIIDPTEQVIALLREMKMHKEDVFFDTFVPLQLVAGYDPGIPGFNINVPEIYKSLLELISLERK